MSFKESGTGKVKILQSFEQEELITAVEKAGKIHTLQYSTVTAMNGKTLYSVFLVLE